MKRVILILTKTLIGTLICSLLSLSHASENSLKGKAYGSFLFFEEIPNALFFFNEIEKNDSFEFRKAVRNHQIDTLVLASPGGSVWEGLTIAGMVFDKKLTTYVPKNSTCTSACAFIFFAGNKRQANGKLGVHQFYNKNGNKTAKIGKVQDQAQFTVSEIIGFLNEFGTPPFVFEKMFAQKSMYYFDEKEIGQLNSNVSKLNKSNVASIDSQVRNLQTKIKNKSSLAKKSKKEISPSKNDLQKSIQAQLNRIGCNVGGADGKIGPASIRGLKNYATRAGIDADPTLFKSEGFLKTLQGKSKGFCPNQTVEKTIASEIQPKPAPTRERKKTIFEGGKCTLNSGNALALLGVFIGYLDCIFPE